MAAEKAQDLGALLDALGDLAARDKGKISIEEVYHAIGERSFGPLLLVFGLLGMTPVAGIPGVPTVLAVVVALIAGQLLFGRKTFWLPKKLLKLSVKSEKLAKTVKILRKPARVVDRLIRPRLTVMTRGLAQRLVALVCVVVAFCVPPLELLPLAAAIPAAAITAFALGLIARDGVLILIALAFSAAALGFLGKQLLG